MNKWLVATLLLAGAGLVQGCAYDPYTGTYVPATGYSSGGYYATYGSPAYGYPAYGSYGAGIVAVPGWGGGDHHGDHHYGWGDHAHGDYHPGDHRAAHYQGGQHPAHFANMARSHPQVQQHATSAGRRNASAAYNPGGPNSRE